jgi:phosphosulfolactate phosphohydrolase-like enzyme
VVVDSRAEHRQRAYDVRYEWGLHGVELLARDCAAVAIVDVLSFCTSVDIAVAAAQFEMAKLSGLSTVLSELSSGRELIADGHGEDVRLAADLDVSRAVPRLVDGVLRR